MISFPERKETPDNQGGTYVECIQKSDLPLSERSSALGPSHAVLCSASGLEEGIGSCTGIHLARLSISEHCLALAQGCMVCTVFFKETRVFKA